MSVFAVSGVELSNPSGETEEKLEEDQWTGNFELRDSADWRGFLVFDPLERKGKK